MTETLLSTSRILLFGRVVTDLQIDDPKISLKADHTVDVATDAPVETRGHPEVDGVAVGAGNRVLVKDNRPKKNGIYVVRTTTQAWNRLADEDQPARGQVVEATGGSNGFWIRKETKRADRFVFEPPERDGGRRLGKNAFLAEQIEDGSFARIYGFSYDGTYYDLARPLLFLIHGDGQPAVLSSNITTAGGPPDVKTEANLARAPRTPSDIGVAAADFEFADAIRVWSYDKSDFTICLDVDSGMFEDVLLAPFFSGDGFGLSGAKVSGAKVSGAKVSGAKVSGARVSGAKISGAKLSGARGDASD